MTALQAMTRHNRRRTLGTVAAVCALGLSAPAAASSSNPAFCDDSKTSALQLLMSDVEPATADGAETSASTAAEPATDVGLPQALPAPAIAAALQKATEEAQVRESDSPEPPVMKTRVPGITDEAMARHKEKMNRKDI